MYDQSTLNDLIVEGLDEIVSLSLRSYRTLNVQTDRPNRYRVLDGIIIIHPNRTEESWNKQPPEHWSNKDVHCRVKPWNTRKGSTNVDAGTMATYTQKILYCSPFPQVLEIDALSTKSSRQCSTQLSSSLVPSISPSFRKVCYDVSLLFPNNPLHTRNSYEQLATIW